MPLKRNVSHCLRQGCAKDVERTVQREGRSLCAVGSAIHCQTTSCVVDIFVALLVTGKPRNPNVVPFAEGID